MGNSSIPSATAGSVAQRLEEIAPEEVERRAAVLFGAPTD